MSKITPITEAYLPKGPDPRATPHARAPRESVFLSVTVVEKETNKSFEARVRNLSATGALLQVMGGEHLNGEISVTFRGVADLSANVVRAEGQHLGIRFDGQIEPVVARKSIYAQSSGVPEWFRNIVAYYKHNRRPGLGS